MDLNSIRGVRSSSRFVLRFTWCYLALSLGCGPANDQSITSGRGGSVQPKSESASQHISLEPLLGGSGNVHIQYHNERPASTDHPFFVVWTDADLYAGSCGYPSPQNNPPRTTLVEGEYRLIYTGETENREVPYSFKITLDEKGEFEIDNKTLVFSKGALILISARGGDVKVQQLSRDPSKFPRDADSVIVVSKDDADVKDFLSKTVKPQ